MNSENHVKKTLAVFMHKWFMPICAAALTLFFALPGMALEETKLFGNSLRLNGYVNTTVAYGIGGDTYDTKEDWQQFRYDILLESQYQISPISRLFVSGMLSGDLAYDILAGDDEWEEKGFSDSRDELSHDTVLRDLLQEAHITLTPGNFVFRLGKQIVAWGEMDGNRVLDVINPLDQRRGITDYEFESTIVPLWLAKAEYYFMPESNWLQDLGIEFTFNPNADFVPNRGPYFGNDDLGIWGFNADGPPVAMTAVGPIPYPAYLAMAGAPPPWYVPGLPPVPSSFGSLDLDIIEDPDEWDSDYFEYGVRIKAIIYDAIVTLNYFYGRSNDAIWKLKNPAQAWARWDTSPFDGRTILHFNAEGFYPRTRLVGATFARDINWLAPGPLGGVAPVLRLEGLYAFDSTFAGNGPTGPAWFEKHDEIRYGIGMDWKIKVDWLNPRAFFFISPQFIARHTRDYPHTYTLNAEKPILDDEYVSGVMVNTTYFHQKLAPVFIWVEDWTNHSTMFQTRLVYEYSDIWNFTLGGVWLNTRKRGVGFSNFEYKDHAYFTISYRF